jgi:PAS domain S-box-containing protein
MVFRETPSAISITTVREGRFLDVNKQAEVLTGYSREELLGRTTTEMNLYVDPAERSRVMEGLQKTGVLTNLERQIRTKSGEIRTAIFSLVPIQMGAEPCLLAIAHDITERKRAEEGLRERSRQQAIEAELSLQAVTVQDLPALLNTAVKLVANALEADYCEALELLPNEGELRLYASAGWKGDRIGQVRAPEPGSLAQAALQSSKPVVRSLPADTQFGGPPWLRKHGAVGGMSVSIPGKDAPWGVMGVYTAGTRAFSRDDINFIQTVASILAATIERMETEGVLRSANQALRLLSRQLLQVQEDERRTIARDLHDEIGQSLTAIKLNVERAQRTSEQAARSRIMQDCIQIAERVLGQVRNLSLDLHPSILDDLGLTYALKWYADRLAERAGVRVEVTADPSLPRLSQDVEIACFRIAQEALTNVVRHARATRADIILKRGAAAVELCVQDDGIGFPADKASSPSSVGLASMQERAKLLGGTIRIVSVPRGGTKVIATLPLLVALPARMPAEEVPRS